MVLYHISLKQNILSRLELHFNAIFNAKTSVSENIYKEQMMAKYLSVWTVYNRNEINLYFFFLHILGMHFFLQA